MNKGKLTLGPLLYHWDAERRRDFYFRIADEAPVDCVYLGETVCSKRAPFFEPYRDETIERLQKAGKQVVLSTLALLTLPREVKALREDAQKGLWLEANDVAAIQILKDATTPFVVGPTINVLNEGAMEVLAKAGAKRIVFASEMNGAALRTLAVRHRDVEKETQVFGRQPLAVAMRCYHARANGRDKDHCRSSCAQDENGLTVQTLTGQDLLTVSGTQTLSYGYVVLLEEMAELRTSGFTHFRLSPQTADMVRIAQIYRDLLDGRAEAAGARRDLAALCGDIPFINGFYKGREGMAACG